MKQSDYVSELTQFLDQYRRDHPHLEAAIRAGRALWWDRPQDPDLLAQWAAARLPTPPYYYDPTAHPCPHLPSGYRPAVPPSHCPEQPPPAEPTAP
ncbi:MAG: DUF3460 family protein [Hydrogenophilus sp.]|nr:DUF3460 family protein [Hydrogenophilus sp.]